MDSVLEYFGWKDTAIKIVAFDENSCKATLDADKLRKIIESRPEIKDLPTMVISIGGVTRSGKSFLLNLLVSYLAHLEKRRNDLHWMKSSCPIKGVSWARSRGSITHGIWMFSRPFIVTRYDGKQAAVLLVDSQGTGDNQRSSAEVDTLITYIGLQISSVHLLNVKGGILNSDHLIQMQLCADYADIDDDASKSMEETHQEEYLFKSLVFLIRDYDSDDHSLGEAPNLFTDLIRDCKNLELKKTVKGIKKAFHSVSSYQMPHPGLEIGKATAGSLKVKDLPKHFLESVRGLAHMLFNLEQPSGGQSQCWESASHLLNDFTTLKIHMENDDLPPFSNPADALQAIVMNQAYLKLQQDLGNEIVQMCQPDELTSFNTEEELNQFYDRAKNEAFEKFKMAAKYRKYEGTAIACKYLEMSEYFFALMYEKEMVRFKYSKKVMDLRKKDEEVERQKQEQKKEHREKVEILTSEIHDRKQREKEREIEFQADKAKSGAEIEELHKMMEGVAHENEEERQKFQDDINSLRSKMKDEAEAQQTAINEYEKQKKELQGKMDKIEESHQEELKSIQEVKDQLVKQHKAVEKEYQDQIESHTNKPLWARIVRVVAGGVQGAIAGLVGGPVGAVVGLTAGAASSLALELT